MLIRSSSSRVCKFQNLYQLIGDEKESRTIQFIFKRGASSIIFNADEVLNARSGDVLEQYMDGMSISNVFRVDLQILDVKSSQFAASRANPMQIGVLDGMSIIMTRYLPFNIMHVIHGLLMIWINVEL